MEEHLWSQESLVSNFDTERLLGDGVDSVVGLDPLRHLGVVLGKLLHYVWADVRELLLLVENIFWKSSHRHRWFRYHSKTSSTIKVGYQIWPWWLWQSPWTVQVECWSLSPSAVVGWRRLCHVRRLGCAWCNCRWHIPQPGRRKCNKFTKHYKRLTNILYNIILRFNIQIINLIKIFKITDINRNRIFSTKNKDQNSSTNDWNDVSDSITRVNDCSSESPLRRLLRGPRCRQSQDCLEWVEDFYDLFIRWHKEVVKEKHLYWLRDEKAY